MNTTCTLRINDFAFTVTGKSGEGYSIEIECQLPWNEKIHVDGMLVSRDGIWRLTKATFEDAHDEIVWRRFLDELLLVRGQAYPEAIRYYEANKPVDIFEAIDKVAQHRKAI